MTRWIVWSCGTFLACGGPTVAPDGGGPIHQDASTDASGDASDAAPAPADATSDAAPPAVTGMMIPLYTFPTDGTWTAVIQAKTAHPSVPIVAIINPNSGPDTSKSPDYAKGIGDLQNAGVTVIGYVATGYGTRNDAETNVSSYVAFYPSIEGIFFDEMSASASDQSYYQTLATFVASKGLALTVGNPGTNVPKELLGIFTNLVIYESAGLPAQSDIDAYFATYGSGPFSFIAYGVASLPTLSALQALDAYVSYVYVTDLGGANPYGALPAYFGNEVAALGP